MKIFLKNLFFVYIPTVVIIGILLVLFKFNMDYLLEIMLVGGITFTTQSFIHNSMKKNLKLYNTIIPVLVFAGLLYYSYTQGNILDKLIDNIFIFQIVYISLLLHRNWSPSRIFLGKILSPHQLKKIKKDRLKRISKLNLNEEKLIGIISEFNGLDRDRLVKEKYIKKNIEKGAGLLTTKHRSKKGDELLERVQDIFYALLYGDEDINVNFERIEDELLTIVIPRLKAYTLIPFMKAVTQVGGRGVWNDPDDDANDDGADNVILEVEYGELKSEFIGNGIKSCVLLLNNLEVNEKILYMRMIDIEQSTLH